MLQLPVALVATASVIGTGLAQMERGVESVAVVVAAPDLVAAKQEDETEPDLVVVVATKKLTIWQLIMWSKTDIIYLIGATLATILDALVGMETPRAVGMLIQSLSSGTPAVLPLGLGAIPYISLLFVVHAGFKLTALSLLSTHSERLCARIKVLFYSPY
jgi:hypothetical protein